VVLIGGNGWSRAVCAHVGADDIVWGMQAILIMQ
jgi:hypothetical protein